MSNTNIQRHTGAVMIRLQARPTRLAPTAFIVLIERAIRRFNEALAPPALALANATARPR